MHHFQDNCEPVHNLKYLKRQMFILLISPVLYVRGLTLIWHLTLNYRVIEFFNHYYCNFDVKGFCSQYDDISMPL